MKKILVSAIMIVFLITSSASAFETIVYSQPYDHNSTNAYGSSFYDGFLRQQCFSDYYYDGSFAITDFHWWGTYTSGLSLSGFTFQIWGEAAGAPIPGNLLYEENFAGNANETWHDFNTNYNLDVYHYGIDLSTPFLAEAGNYWFSVYSHSNQFWYWAMTDGFYGNYDMIHWGMPVQDNWQNTQSENRDFAFEITSSNVIPEPATLCLLGLGLAGLGVIRRRKK